MNPTQVRRVLELVQLLQLHREISGRFLAGVAGLADERARVAAWIGMQLARRLPSQCRGLMAYAWCLLSRMVGKRAISAGMSDLLHAALIRRYLVAAERMPAAGSAAEPIDGLRHSLSAGKLAIQAQLQACFRALEQHPAAS